jgi:hypothetical protein
MDTEKQAELVRLFVRADEEANALLVQAIEVYEMTKKLEDLTKDTTIRYAGLRVRVEARAAFEQATDLRTPTPRAYKPARISVGDRTHPHHIYHPLVVTVLGQGTDRERIAPRRLASDWCPSR